MVRVALTIAGSDSGGGAGIQADLKTFGAFGVFGTTVITALTAQNTYGVRAVAEVSPAFIRSQLDAVREDFAIAAAKTGMLARRAIIEVVASYLGARRLRNLVVDPVMVAASGDVLLAPDAIEALRELMLPLATVVTPNVREAEMLTGTVVRDLEGMHRTAQAILELGPQAVLVKGGRLGGAASIDVLLGKMARLVNSKRRESQLTVLMERVVHCPRQSRRLWRLECPWIRRSKSQRITSLGRCSAPRELVTVQLH